MKNPFFQNKRADRDYSPASLPQTRRAVFFDVLKLNWRQFILYGLLFLAVCLPMQLVSLSEAMAAVNLQNSQDPQWVYKLAMTRILAAGIQMPCLWLIGLALSGFARVMRQYAWMENVRFSYEFIQGVKQNGLQMLGLAVLAGLGNGLFALCAALAEAAQLLPSVILMIPAALLLLCLLPVAAYAVAAIPVYKGKLAAQLRVGRLLYAQNPWKTLLGVGCCLAPCLVQLSQVFLVKIIGAVLAPVAAPVVLLGWTLFAYEAMDRHINETLYPELVGRGLWNG